MESIIINTSLPTAQIKDLKLQMLKVLTEATVIRHVQKNQMSLTHNGSVLTKRKEKEKLQRLIQKLSTDIGTQNSTVMQSLS